MIFRWDLGGTGVAQDFTSGPAVVPRTSESSIMTRRPWVLARALNLRATPLADVLGGSMNVRPMYRFWISPR